MKKVFLQCQIWGDAFYSDMFVKYAIPYIKDMLGEIKYPIEMHLYLDEESRQKLKLDFNFPILIHNIEDISNADWLYTKEADCKYHCMQQAITQDAGIIFIDPNQLVAKGSWTTMIKYIEQGYDACITKALRVSDKINITWERNPRDLVRSCLYHIHPIEQAWYVDNIWKEQTMCYPCAIYKPVVKQLGDLLSLQGFITRALHMAIPMVYPKTLPKREGFSPDHCFGFENVKVIQDSDEAFFAEICRDNFGEHGKEKFSGMSLAERWKQIISNEHHFTLQNVKHAQYPIQIHWDDLDMQWGDSLKQLCLDTSLELYKEIERREASK